MLGDTEQEAQEYAAYVRGQQVSGQTAIKFAEQLWNRDLSDLDPDGPLPDVDPIVGENTIARGRASVRMYTDPIATAQQWRELAAAKGLSLREVDHRGHRAAELHRHTGNRRGDHRRVRAGRRQ